MRMRIEVRCIKYKNGKKVKVMMKAEKLQLTNEWDKVFPQSDKVNHRKYDRGMTQEPFSFFCIS